MAGDELQFELPHVEPRYLDKDGDKREPTDLELTVQGYFSRHANAITTKNQGRPGTFFVPKQYATIFFGRDQQLTRFTDQDNRLLAISLTGSLLLGPEADAHASTPTVQTDPHGLAEVIGLDPLGPMLDARVLIDHALGVLDDDQLVPLTISNA